jgi:Na+/citrate or Na+/malate symporter
MSLVIEKFFGSKKCRRRSPARSNAGSSARAIGVNPVETYIRAGTCRQAMGVTIVSRSLPLGSTTTLAALPAMSRLPAAPLSSYRLVGAGLYPAWVASCSVMYLPFLVVP